VEIYEKDLIILMESGERIKEAFLKCAEKSLVFPFIPFRDLKIDEIFKSGWIKKTCFGFPSSHFISGFEIITKSFGRIKYGGKIYKTNTGFYITNIFFGSKESETLKIINLKTELQDFSIEKLYIKLLPRALVYVRKKEKEKNNNEEKEEMERKDTVMIKKGSDIFFIYDHYYEQEDFYFEMKFELPQDYQKLLEFISEGEITPWR
jgi:hypothetical protein